MNNKRRIYFSVLVAAAWLIALASTAAAGRGTAATASTARDALVTFSGINNHGQIVGTLITKSSVEHGFVWRNGSVKLLGAEADEINERGEILGYAAYSKARGPLRPVLWEHGKTRRLGLHDVGSLNNRGQVLGYAGRISVPCPPASGQSGCYQRHPALWTNGRIRLLPFSPDGNVAMNDLGQVVGQTTGGDAAEWQDGTLTDLGPGDPIAINDRGQILGSRDREVIVWQNGIATDIGTGTPVAINERGQVTWFGAPQKGDQLHTRLWPGDATPDLGGFQGDHLSDRGQIVGSTGDNNVQWWVWQDGTMTRLPKPRGYGGYDQVWAVAINDHNQIVGQVCSSDCLRSPRKEFVVIWTLKGNKVETRRLGIRQFRRALNPKGRRA